MARTTRENIPAVTRPSNVPTTVWSKMAPLQKYNLSKGLLNYDNRTKKIKQSRLATDGLTNKSITRPRTTKSKNKEETLVMVSGQGSFKFSDKSSYLGEMKNGVLHGNGTRIWRDKSTYTGQWRNGVRHGQGRMVYPSGVEYIGQWKNDAKSGRGTIFRKNGSMFTGDWQDNLVENPYTRKSEYEKSLEAYNLYKSYQGNRLSVPYGTYIKIGKRLGISRLEANRLVTKHKDIVQKEHENLSSLARDTKKTQTKQNPFPFLKMNPNRVKFVVGARKVLGNKTTVINRKMIYEVLDQNKNLSFPGWAVDRRLSTTTRGVYYFPDKEGNFNIDSVSIPQSKKKAKKRSITSSSIDKLDLPTGISNCLKRAGIYTLRNLTRLTETDLLSFRLIGQNAINQIKKSLKKYGLELKSRESAITDTKALYSDIRNLSLKQRRQLRKPSSKRLRALDRYGASIARYYD